MTDKTKDYKGDWKNPESDDFKPYNNDLVLEDVEISFFLGLITLSNEMVNKNISFLLSSSLGRIKTQIEMEEKKFVFLNKIISICWHNELKEHTKIVRSSCIKLIETLNQKISEEANKGKKK